MTKQLAVNFDTLAYSKKLEAGGMSRELAHIQVETLVDIFSSFTTEFATKPDMKIALSEVHHAMRDLENRLTIKLGGIVAAGVAVLVAIQHFS